MRLLRAIGSFGLGLALVGSAFAIGAFLLGLARGNLDARHSVAAAIGVVLLVAMARLARFERVLGGFAGLMFVFLYAPILVVIVYSFNSGRNVASFESFSLTWYDQALHDEQIRDAVGRSVQIAIASALVATILGTAAALALGRLRPIVRLPFDILVFLTLVVPELVLAISALIFFVNSGFELGKTTMFLGHTIFNASLVMLIVRARFVSMGSTLEEASFDLGAGPFATFRQVTLPRLLPAVLAGGLLAFVFSFDDVVVSNFTSGAGSQTWPLYILSALKFGLLPSLNATATMMFAVTLIALVVVGLILRSFGRKTGEAAVGSGTIPG
jgi:ABC-type spermidine/putrescine transport system permease subunit II